MISPELKFRLASKKIARLPKVEVKPGGPGTVRKLAVILDGEDLDLIRKFRDFREDLRVSSENWQLVICTNEEVSGNEGLRFSSSEINWRGGIVNAGILEFFKGRYDLLIAYTQSESPLLNLLLKSAQADFKVGRKEEVPELYDLSISSRFEEVEVFLAEVKKYLKILKKTA